MSSFLSGKDPDKQTVCSTLYSLQRLVCLSRPPFACRKLSVYVNLAQFLTKTEQGRLFFQQLLLDDLLV